MKTVYVYRPDPISLSSIFKHRIKYACRIQYVLPPSEDICILTMLFFYRNWENPYCNCNECNIAELPSG